MRRRATVAWRHYRDSFQEHCLLALLPCVPLAAACGCWCWCCGIWCDWLVAAVAAAGSLPPWHVAHTSSHAFSSLPLHPSLSLGWAAVQPWLAWRRQMSQWLVLADLQHFRQWETVNKWGMTCVLGTREDSGRLVGPGGRTWLRLPLALPCMAGRRGNENPSRGLGISISIHQGGVMKRRTGRRQAGAFCCCCTCYFLSLLPPVQQLCGLVLVCSPPPSPSLLFFVTHSAIMLSGDWCSATCRGALFLNDDTISGDYSSSAARGCGGVVR